MESTEAKNSMVVRGKVDGVLSLNLFSISDHIPHCQPTSLATETSGPVVKLYIVLCQIYICVYIYV